MRMRRIESKRWKKGEKSGKTKLELTNKTLFNENSKRTKKLLKILQRTKKY